MNSVDYFLKLNLSQNFLIRELAAADAEAATDLVRKVDIAACGETTTTVAELQSDIAESIRNGGTPYGIFQNNQMRICLLVQNELIDHRGTFMDIFIDPELDLDLATELTSQLIQATTAYSQDFLKIKQLPNDYVKTALYENDHAFVRALAQNQFSEHRTYWRLRIDHADITETSQPAVIEIRDFAETETAFREMHSLSTEIFQDHYDFNPMSFDRWKETLTSGVHEPRLWRVAYYEGRVAGYCWRSNRFNDEGFAYVSSIGVLREFRGRGIAKYLLADAFQKSVSAGLQGTLLHCDSENPNGATALYERVGMRIDRVYKAFHKEIGTSN